MRAAFARAASTLRALRHDRQGASIIEMGLIAPVLGLFTVAIVDLSQAASQRFTMQQAVDRSLQMVIANPPQGDPEEDGIDYSYVATEAAAAADVPEQNVTLTRWLECDGQRQQDFSGSCGDGEDTARYLSLEMTDTFDGKVWIGTLDLAASGAVRIQ